MPSNTIPLPTVPLPDKNYTLTLTQDREVVSIVAYLLGVRDTQYKPNFIESKYDELESDNEAKFFRELCKLRTVLLRFSKDISNDLKYNTPKLKNVDSARYIDFEFLIKCGCKFVANPHKFDEYLIEVNRFINNQLPKIEHIFNGLVDFVYIQEIFKMPNYTHSDTNKKTIEHFINNFSYYPYNTYINMYIAANDQNINSNFSGDCLRNDSRFLSQLYHKFGVVFDSSVYKRPAIDEAVVITVKDFINDSDKIIIVVDCENTDVYKFHSFLKCFEDSFSKVVKIILVNDINNKAVAWKLLDEFTDLAIQHLDCERVVDHKSLVDVRVTHEVCREHYQNQVSNFILVSSDSDYWELISQMSAAKFFVLYEKQRSSNNLRALLEEHKIPHTSIDDYCKGLSNNKLKDKLLSDTINAELAKHNISLQQLIGKAYARCFIEANENEKSFFIDRCKRGIKLKIEGGVLKLELVF